MIAFEMITVNLSSKILLSLAIIVSVSSTYIHYSEVHYFSSLVILLLITLDLRNRIKDFYFAIKKPSHINSWLLVVTFTTVLVTVITLFVNGSLISFDSKLYPDVLLTSSLISQFSTSFQSQPLFGLEADLNYYPGAFSFFGRLHDIYPIPPYEFLVFFALPYLTIILFLTLYVAVNKLLSNASPILIMTVFLFLLFSNGNFLLQPNIDDRPLGLLPFTSLTQFIGLILFLDFFSLLLQSNFSVRNSLKQIMALLIALSLVKLTMLVCVAALIFIQLTLKMRLRVFVFAVISICAIFSIFALLYPTIIVFSPQLPSLRSDSIVLCVSILILIYLVKSRVEFDFALRLAWCFFSLQVWLFVFDVYNEKGSEIWFVEPLRTVLLLQLASVVVSVRHVTQSNILLICFLSFIYVVDTIAEFFKVPAIERILLNLFLLFVAGCFCISRVYPRIFQDFLLLRAVGFRASSQLVVAITLLASFNPLLLIQSTGLVKNGTESVSMVFSRKDIQELRAIENILKRYDVSKTLVFSNSLCLNSVNFSSDHFVDDCDSRVFLVSGLLGFRNPFENWKFPVWKSEIERRSHNRIVSEYVMSLSSSNDTLRWLSEYSDPVVDNPNQIFFLLDNHSSLPVKLVNSEIFVGKRFRLYLLVTR